MYNQENFISDAVSSALSQSPSSKEIIVVDDASSDRTAKVLEQYGDPIHLIKLKKNQGANKARNGEIPKPKFNDIGEGVKIVEYENLINKDRTYRGSVSAI